MANWLLKSEPCTYSWADLLRDGSTDWDGVRNTAARLHLRAMQPGDEALFYHSGTRPRGRRHRPHRRRAVPLANG